MARIVQYDIYSADTIDELQELVKTCIERDGMEPAGGVAVNSSASHDIYLQAMVKVRFPWSFQIEEE